MGRYIRPKRTGKLLLEKGWTKQRILTLCISGAAMLLLAAALCVFLLRQPHQPEAPSDMAMAEMTLQAFDTAKPDPTPIATTEPEITSKPLIMQDSFQELYEENSDIVGWIKVVGTDIDYPILQAKDNSFYMDKDFYKEYSYPGSIFLDFRCDYKNMYMSAHQIVYGHNMKNGTMFQQLTKYQDEVFFKDNRLINIDTLYGNYVFEVFSAYETPVTFYYLETDFKTGDDWLIFIKQLQQKSDFESDIILSPDDVVLTLSTCTNRHDDNYRYVVHARLTNPERYDMVYQYIYR